MTDPAIPRAPAGFYLVNTERSEELAALSSGLRWRALGRPSIACRANRPAEIAITFDDGPSRWTAEIAAAFEEHECQATFFMRGPAVIERPQAAGALAATGHEIGNHLWSHSDPATQSRSEIRAEIKRTAKAIRSAGGPRPRIVRPPYSKAPLEVARAASRTGVRAIVLNSIGSSDWNAHSSDEILEPVLACARGGEIVCMHDGISPDERDTDSRDATAAAVKQLVPALLERGLRPVTASRLLRLDELG